VGARRSSDYQQRHHHDSESNERAPHQGGGRRRDRPGSRAVTRRRGRPRVRVEGRGSSCSSAPPSAGARRGRHGPGAIRTGGSAPRPAPSRGCGR
jgi:hypothetical protein